MEVPFHPRYIVMVFGSAIGTIIMDPIKSQFTFKSPQVNIVMIYQHSLSKGVMSVNHFHEQTMNETNNKLRGFGTTCAGNYELINPQP